ncbi:MAG: four helix bundle protein [Prevotella sp.]|nr:four helix bundle protein [Prevotella sp.]
MNDFFYKKLDAYQIAKEFTIYVYSLLANFPAYEQYGICIQLRRAAVSVPSNDSLRINNRSIMSIRHL